MRESVLRDLAQRAATDPEFLSLARRDLEGTLARYGYDLTPDELKVVTDLQRRTAILGNGTLAAMLAGGLRNQTGGPPVGPAAPNRPGGGLSRPGAPGPPKRRQGPGETRGGPSPGGR